MQSRNRPGRLIIMESMMATTMDTLMATKRGMMWGKKRTIATATMLAIRKDTIKVTVMATVKDKKRGRTIAIAQSAARATARGVWTVHTKKKQKASTPKALLVRPRSVLVSAANVASLKLIKKTHLFRKV